jgi:hypothetical protein
MRYRPETPYEDGLPDISELQEQVLMLLEAAGIDTATNDAIVALINAAEVRKQEESDDGLQVSE